MTPVPVLVESHEAGPVARTMVIPNPTDAAVADVLWSALDEERPVAPRNVGDAVTPDDGLLILVCRALASLAFHGANGAQGALRMDDVWVSDLTVVQALEQTGWLHLAACKGTPIDWWMPGRGEDMRYGRQARARCVQCPVVAQCFTDAMATPLGSRLQGVQAGLSTKRRNVVRSLTVQVWRGDRDWHLPAGVEHRPVLVQQWTKAHADLADDALRAA